MSIIFYTTHCPKCKVMEMKLKQSGLNYHEIDDVDRMLSIGITSAPCLGVEGKILGFADGIKFLNNYIKGGEQ